MSNINSWSPENYEQKIWLNIEEHSYQSPLKPTGDL